MSEADFRRLKKLSKTRGVSVSRMAYALIEVGLARWKSVRSKTGGKR